jgi:rhodanese-related sulfurtransferase
MVAAVRPRIGALPLRPVLIFVADLAAQLDGPPRAEPIRVICSNGHRASIAAGRKVRLIATGGVGE